MAFSQTVGTLLRANALLDESKTHADFELRFQPVDPYSGSLLLVTDSALGNVLSSGSSSGAPLEKVFSQACYYVVLADAPLLRSEEGCFNLIDTRSHRLARVCRSSYAAETLGAVRPLTLDSCVEDSCPWTLAASGLGGRVDQLRAPQHGRGCKGCL